MEIRALEIRTLDIRHWTLDDIRPRAQRLFLLITNYQ